MQQLFNRAINILLKPGEEWNKIGDEAWTVQDLFVKYAVILAAIPAVAGLIGHSLVGMTIPFMGRYRLPLSNGILWSLLQYATSLGGAFLVALIMDALAPSFGAKKDMATSQKVVIFSLTASWLGGVFNIIPSLAIIGALFGIYSLVLLYIGMKQIRGVAPDKMVGYYIAVLVISLVMFIVLGLIVSAIAMPSLGAADLSGVDAFKLGD